MKHRLASARSGIGYRTIACGDLMVARELCADQVHMSDKVFILFRCFQRGGEMLPRNHQQMNRGLRVDVLECQAAVVGIDDLGGNLARDDLAEDA